MTKPRGIPKLRHPAPARAPDARRNRHSVIVLRSFIGPWMLVVGHFFAPFPTLPSATAQERDELASFTVAPGFDRTLFASETNVVVKPIQRRWAPRGRLWIIGSTVYPQLQPGEVPDDKIIILEDTDRDGRADKTTIFARGLMIPTGIELDGDARGCYLGEGTQL